MAPKHFYDSQPGAGYVTDMAHYRQMYDQSINDPETFFGEKGREFLDWDRPFTKVKSGSLEKEMLHGF